MYGFERRAESIPLTRSKQERNLEELSGWVARLEALPIGDLDERLLANAFTTCHSEAEVYRIEAIEEVFGSIDDLEPEDARHARPADARQPQRRLATAGHPGDRPRPAAARRTSAPRSSAATRSPARSSPRGLDDHPGHYALIQAGAAVDHDLNNYLPAT